jgi:hypothetical protein
MDVFSCKRSGGWRCGIDFGYRNAVANLDGLDLAFIGYIHLSGRSQSGGRRCPRERNPGVAYVNVAQTLLDAGAYHAINLGGGGSTALIVKDSGKFIEKMSSTRSPLLNFGFK